ncbi:MAG: HD domain-containing protein [Peptoniphilaceae bacterium]
MKKNIDLDFDFLIEIDKLKNVKRKVKNIYSNRYENDAEHTYHIALMASILSDYVDKDINLLKVLKMLLIHDLVEIDAGDTFAYDLEAYKYKYEREQKAADRIFSLLSEEKSKEFRKLFDEFENLETDESKYANLIDRLAPILLNAKNDGGSWRENSIKKQSIYKRIEFSKEISLEIYNYGIKLIDSYFNEV